MKKTALFTIISLVVFLYNNAPAQESRWQDTLTPQIGCEDINRVIFGSKESGLIFAATRKGLYYSNDAGATYSRIFHSFIEEKSNVLSVAVKGNTIFAGTRNGLYISHNLGKNWIKAGGTLRGKVFKDIIAGEYIYAVSEEGLFVSEDSGGPWRRIFLGRINQPRRGEGVDETIESGDEEISAGSVNALEFIGEDEKRLALGAQSGLYILEFTKTGISIEKIASLGGIEILDITSSPDKKYVYVSSEDNIYQFLPEKNAVREVDTGENLYRIKGVTFNPRSGRYCVIDKQGIYELEFAFTKDTISAGGIEQPNKSVNTIEAEPTIRQLHTAAIRYAEVSPEKIQAWRRQARIKALLPELSIDYDKTINFDSSDDTYRIGPYDWGVSVKWNLGELLWNDDQTSIDVRSRLMVQLRNDILEDLDRLYFQRRRLQKKLIEQRLKGKVSEELILKIEELTARIDALTGGYLSEYITRHSQY